MVSSIYDSNITRC